MAPCLRLMATGPLCWTHGLPRTPAPTIHTHYFPITYDTLFLFLSWTPLSVVHRRLPSLRLFHLCLKEVFVYLGILCYPTLHSHYFPITYDTFCFVFVLPPCCPFPAIVGLLHSSFFTFASKKFVYLGIYCHPILPLLHHYVQCSLGCPSVFPSPDD